MNLDQILDVFEGLLVASEHPDIVSVERYGVTPGQPWGPNEATSRSKHITGVMVKYRSGATASLWGAVEPDVVSIPMPAEMPPVYRRSLRLPILTAQLLDVARPQEFKSWFLASFLNVGLESERGKVPYGLGIECADGTKMLFRCTSTGAPGKEPTEDPFPGYVIPEGVKTCHLRASVPSAGQG